MNSSSLVRLPEKIDYCLFLIKEELKCRHFFNSLHFAGVEDVYFQPNLDLLILKYVGLDDGNDETFDFYSGVMEKRSRKIAGNNEAIVGQALKVYIELMGERRRRRVKQHRTEG
jgi:hypothetical protein